MTGFSLISPASAEGDQIPTHTIIPIALPEKICFIVRPFPFLR